MSFRSDAIVASLILILAGAGRPGSAAEWHGWRGPTQDGVSTETGLISSWSVDGENLIWVADLIGRSTPVILDGRVCANGRVGEGITKQEVVACYDAGTGKKLWEHRFNLFHTTVPFSRVGWANLAGDPERRAVLTAFFLGTSWVFVVALAILTVFYCLDSLYAERKDKSILFWRSLPVTDAETVVSKLITAIWVLPTVATMGIIATHIVNLVVTSIWVSMKGGDASFLIWGSVSIFDNWAAAYIALLAMGIWMSPFIGWFLLVSAYTKRSPLLMAFMPLILIGIIEPIVMGTHVFADKVLARGDDGPAVRL